ncbi:MAG: UDP-N-acetylmuramoyl-L-alanine--D-glutamate ligase [Gammaproteobacteria bacterium]
MEFELETRARSTEPTVLVMGMGVTGASCARHFAARGIAAEFADTRERPPGMGQILDAMPDARTHVGGEPYTLPDTIRRIVLSPGVELDSALLAEAGRRQLEVVSDIDLFVAECTAPIVAVTGSNGKSTVTSMLGSILNATGKRALVGGNIGTPALDLLDPSADVYVLELSSFQLERSTPIPAAAGVILNISPDHLDQHRDIHAYAAAKARVYLACDHAILNRDDPALARHVPKGCVVTSFGMSVPGDEEFGLVSTLRGECIAVGANLLLATDELPLIGRHNISNAMAALAAGAVVGGNPAAMAQALKRYRGLPHRMEVVGEFVSVTWIDDSKATNVGAALASIAGVSDPFVLIAGGDAKGASFRELAAALRARHCEVILFGRDADSMSIELRDACPVHRVEGMAAAVRLAAQLAAPGGSVLLAPACSSLDMFDDFAARGDAFAAAVRELDS